MKAQLTVEFLIILVVMVLLFTGISLDLIGNSVDDSIYIQTSQLLNSANFMIGSTEKNLLLQGASARKTLIIHAPKKCDLIFGSTIKAECTGEDVAQFNGMELGIQNKNVKHTQKRIKGGMRSEIEFYK